MSDGRLHPSFNAFHDGDADVWVARSAEGRITTEAPSRDALVERLWNQGSGMLRATLRSPSTGRSADL
jgi:hypothetical protein